MGKVYNIIFKFECAVKNDTLRKAHLFDSQEQKAIVFVSMTSLTRLGACFA